MKESQSHPRGPSHAGGRLWGKKKKKRDLWAEGRTCAKALRYRRSGWPCCE